ncbi:MAG: transglycosylase domain-containing protein [Firmicutes bacterium]|nr:transglycosylase domain-containing protein [Bacillota bacterium]
MADQKKTNRSNADNNTEFYYGTGSENTGSKAGRKRKKAVYKITRPAKNSSSRKKRAVDAPPPKKLGPVMTILSFLLLFGTMGVLAVGIFVGVIFLKAPNVQTDDIYSQIKQRSIVYDSDGNEMENLYFDQGNRTIVKYDQIPENMVNAVVAIEDNKFWTHNGFNFIRMIGAIKDSVFGGGSISGTSTVTQQLARNFYLADIMSQRSMNRKITEMYCTIILEKNLTKKQIMEAYLNTIYMGFNTYGVEAASQAYFNKSVSDLDLLECASLAALPQSPDIYALVIADYYKTINNLPVIDKSSSVNYLYNGDASADRRNYAINHMCELGMISEEDRDKALNESLKDQINLGFVTDDRSSYFADYAISQLQKELMEKYNLSENEAQNMVYTTGLQIYTTMDSSIQKKVEEEFEDSDNYTSVSYIRTNEDGDLVSSDTGVVLLQSYDKYFDSKDRFKLKDSEYKTNDDGGITIKSGKRLNFYEIEVNGEPDISVEFKSMYENDDGVFYFIESGAISIPQGYKSLDDKGNCVISGQFFTDYPDFFQKDGDTLIVDDEKYTLKQKIRQPQAACVIMENKTGEIKAMMGGRGATGKQLYNRAVHTRQPGSSIKPIAVYGPALQLSFEKEADGKKMKLDKTDGDSWGKFITAGSIINDHPIYRNGKQWPKNSGGGYSGKITLRRAVQQSVNVCAVKVFDQIGINWSLKMLKKNGITSIDEEGSTNDLNAAALALGGLTDGITPLELTAAYATFPNGGVYKTPVFYTKVLDNKGQVLLEKKTETHQVYDPGVAWIMTDILHSVVTRGIGSSADIPNQPVGGKTGTTSDQYDIWFAGFTPQYTMALWEGNDVNIELSSMSGAAASFWSSIMTEVCEDLPREDFAKMPDNVTKIAGEYYTKGTYSRVVKTRDKKDSKKDRTTTRSTTISPPDPVTTQAPTTQAPTTTKAPDPPAPDPPAPDPPAPDPPADGG